MTTYLIDADIVAFKAATATEQAVDWGDGLWTLHGYASDAEAYCENYFAELQDKLGKGDLRLYLSDHDNWRRKILPTYKANRAGTRKPLMLPVIREWMRTKYDARSMSGLEADDMLGIKATKDKGCVIISEDKDLKTIVNYATIVKLIKKLIKKKHYNFLETLAEAVFNELFKDKRIGKIMLKIEKLEILKECSSVGIQISKIRSHVKS